MIVVLILLYRLPFCLLAGFSLPFIVHIVYPVLYGGFPHLAFVWDIFYKAFRVQPHFFCHADFFIPDTAFFLCLIPQFLLICHFFFPPIVQGNPIQGLFPSYPRISQAALPRHLTYPLCGMPNLRFTFTISVTSFSSAPIPPA